MTNAGIPVAMAAGNGYNEASLCSPAHAPTAITVAASTIADSFSAFSNYGTPIDAIAPGISYLLSHLCFRRSSDSFPRGEHRFYIERWEYKHPERHFYGMPFSI
jgi:Subtilase family